MPTIVVMQDFRCFRMDLVRGYNIEKSINYPSLFDLMRAATEYAKAFGKGEGQYDGLQLTAINKRGLLVHLCDVDMPSPQSAQVDRFIITGVEL